MHPFRVSFDPTRMYYIGPLYDWGDTGGTTIQSVGGGREREWTCRHPPSRCAKRHTTVYICVYVCVCVFLGM